MTPEGYLTIKEAMREMGVARATMFKLLKERNITRYEVAGSREVLIRKSDLDELRKPVPRQAPPRSEIPSGKMLAAA